MAQVGQQWENRKPVRLGKKKSGESSGFPFSVMLAMYWNKVWWSSPETTLWLDVQTHSHSKPPQTRHWCVTLDVRMCGTLSLNSCLFISITFYLWFPEESWSRSRAKASNDVTMLLVSDCEFVSIYKIACLVKILDNKKVWCPTRLCFKPSAVLALHTAP